MKFVGKPLLLMILDGWGMPNGAPGDALSLAHLPNFHRLWENYPHTTLGASGPYVGLPEGQMGDSEVGHMNIGSGRIIYQDFTRISKAIENGDFFDNPIFTESLAKTKKIGGALHIYGLLSDGGIHSHLSHLLALLNMAKKQQVKEVFVHCFADGRDTPPRSVGKYIKILEAEMARLQIGRIASLIGRFYAMDRDKHWERVASAYNLLVYGQGKPFSSALDAVEASYEQDITDEFMKPAVMVDDSGQPLGLVKEGDTIIFYNYRSDRAREISHAFADSSFDFFDRGNKAPKVNYICMTSYDDTLKNASVAFLPSPPVNTLGKILSRNGLRQLRIAETEKYAHVTFFFNGGVEQMEIGEDRVMIPSPSVETYDLMPEMNSSAVTKAVIDRIESGIYDVIVLNYANPDMIGHTGNLQATVLALNAVDACLGQVEKAVRDMGGTLFITADHGNVEKMISDEGKPMTSHTTGLVPFIFVDDKLKDIQLREGRLEDISPTVLQLLDVRQPAEMTGKSLIVSGLQDYNQVSLNF